MESQYAQFDKVNTVCTQNRSAVDAHYSLIKSSELCLNLRVWSLCEAYRILKLVMQTVEDYCRLVNWSNGMHASKDRHDTHIIRHVLRTVIFYVFLKESRDSLSGLA